MPNADLERRRARRKPLVRFYVFCEGENTEPGYFAALNRKVGRDQIKVQSIASGAPSNILIAAKRKKEELAQDKDSGPDDQVWAVFDEDGRASFAQSLRQLVDAGISVAPSNSCFELWLIAHHADEFSTGNQRFLAARLAALDRSYQTQQKTMDFDSLLAGLDSAETRAERAANAAIGSGSENGRGTTYVYRLTRAIRQAAKDFAGT
jgi:hypothetical protein